MTSLTVIFDIDGVIVDSEQLHFDVLQTLLPEQTRPYTPEQFIGLSLEETLNFIGVATDLHASIACQMIDTYKKRVAPYYLRPSVKKLIHRLQQKHVGFGFVSTAPRHLCLANVGLLNLAEPLYLIGGKDLVCTKPFPDPYLAMLMHLHADPQNTVVIEDTDIGISAAHQAGIERIYAWPHSLSSQQQYHQATAVIESLNDIAEFS